MTSDTPNYLPPPGPAPGGGILASCRVQVALTLTCWLWLCGCHWQNDGLWFQGDAPRHLLTGVFWGDFVVEGWSDPADYARRYYARYPAIVPTRYPPLFHWLEALVFAVAGFSAHAAKGLVLSCALISAFYLQLALRRWIAPAAGLCAGLLLWLPAMTTWSHAVMTNVPALTCGLATLVHIRWGLDELPAAQTRRHLGIGISLLMLSILIHPTSAYVAVIALTWLAMDRRLRFARNPRLALTAIACVTTLGAVFLLLRNLSPDQFSQARITNQQLTSSYSLLFYIRTFPRMIGPPTLGPAIVLPALFGLVAHLWSSATRRDGLRLLVAAIIAYVALTPIWAKDERYLLLACPWAIILFACAAHHSHRILTTWWSPRPAAGCILIATLLLATTLAESTRRLTLPRVNGMDAVERSVAEIVGKSPIFYEGHHDGLFVYHVRRRDTNRERQVILLKRWLEGNGAVAPQLSASDITARIAQSGCSWLLLEQPRPFNRKNRWHQRIRTLGEHSELKLVQAFEDLPDNLPSLHLYRITSANDAASPPSHGTTEPIKNHPSSAKDPPPRSLPIPVQGWLVEPLR